MKDMVNTSKQNYMPLYPKQDPSLDENHQQTGGGQLSQWMKMVKSCNGLN
jgi:hypothetical protein